MAAKHKIPGTDEAWDSQELGADANFAAPFEGQDEQDIDAALELQPISIRLQKSLIEDFKLIAQLNGLGYQPLMRQVLTRFADCEKKRILREFAAATAAKREEDEARNTPDDEPRSGTHG